MISEIKNISNQQMVDLNYLKNSKLPLLLYGTGQYAKRVKCFLEENNIQIDSVVLDNDFYKPNTFFGNEPIQLISDVMNKYLHVNVVFAFGNYRKKMAELSLCERVSKCIFFDGLLFPGFDNKFIEIHYSEFAKLYDRLADELSREILIAFIKAKHSGCSDELYKLNVKNEKQYFPSLVHLSDNEVFVDCGAFDGDTVLAFSEHTGGKYHKIYAFEPDEVNVNKMKYNIKSVEITGGGVQILSKACYSSKTILSFSNDGTTSSKIGDGTLQIETDTIDNVASAEKVSFIKMDIEGSELEALKGAKNTIINNKPKLAICVYHKQEDLITIPQYILSLNPDYKLYLRHYGDNDTELVLYAI